MRLVTDRSWGPDSLNQHIQGWWSMAMFVQQVSQVSLIIRQVGKLETQKLWCVELDRLEL